MLRLLIDQDFNHHVLRGLTARIPGLDAVTARQAGLSSATDPDLLAWAASEGRAVVTYAQKVKFGMNNSGIDNGQLLLDMMRWISGLYDEESGHGFIGRSRGPSILKRCVSLI